MHQFQLVVTYFINVYKQFSLFFCRNTFTNVSSYFYSNAYYNYG